MLPTKDTSSILDTKIKDLEILIQDYVHAKVRYRKIIFKAIFWNLGYIQGFLKSCEKYNIGVDLEYYNTRMSAIYSWIQKNG